MSAETEQVGVALSHNQVVLEEKKHQFQNSARELEDLRAQVSFLRNQYEELSRALQDEEEEYHSLQAQVNKRLHEVNETQIRFEQAKMKKQVLIEQIRERYMLNLSDVWETHFDPNFELNETESNLKDLKERLYKIGEVNLSAIEEYKQTSERYEFLTAQQSDLIEAKEQLRRVIDRINRICSRRFKDTFDLVNERFTKVFPVLFGGGEARLELVEDPEKAELGIEIIAKPPGKKMQNVSLLSGGEKALTAVSLVFAIFLVKPSPYCLLDEVDAPLDDANVSRFNDLVREMAKRSQIIVVTHNKHTMEIAGKLYGVTMQNRGVSTMVSVNLNDLS
jgi:chromosome segregation protein